MLKKMNILLLTFAFLATSCVQNTGPGKRTSGEAAQVGDSSNNGGQGAVGDDLTNVTDALLANGAVDLRHIVDPFDGTYKTKVTIPKNYKGLLYLSGLNVTSLNSKLVTVRFRFGREKEMIEVPASIGRAPGITPDTDIEVLILDMEDQPLNDLRLLYDLYDYNDYDTNNDNIEFGTGDTFSEPTTDVRDSGIYCRGLKLEDDPTFNISGTNSACDATGEKCLYSYAKIKDSGLYYSNAGSLIALTPTEPQVDLNQAGYANETQTELLKKCLPDVSVRTAVENSLVTTMSGAGSVVAYGETGFGGNYSYLGPYRSVARNDWEVSGDALFSDVGAGQKAYGLFQYSLTGGPTATPADPNAAADGGFKSFLFPRAGKMDLQSNVEYLGYTDISNALTGRGINSLVSSGDTEFMDGCNIRVTNYDTFTNEGIHSCNVTATIEILAKDPTTGTTTTVTTSQDIKLQISRPSLTDYQGKEILYSSLKTCSNSQACGANECCFNNRCWGRDLVSQCLDDVPGEGNLSIGATCSSDYQCNSLCCNSATSRCSVHNSGLDVFCAKSPGQACVTKEFCKKENIPSCFVVKTGISNQGQVTCSLRCYNVPTFGDCENGICIPPDIPAVPDFDPENPDCSNAIDPPSGF
tara:strand:+ start:225728 stop:227641 length:1914 start_codon:yes stop_codon:yes gene_type:complete